MFEKLSNLGAVLTQTEQKSIQGGFEPWEDWTDTYNYCDNLYPNSFYLFDQCMIAYGPMNP